MSGFLCPVCGYPNLPAPPADYEICPSCMTEFGYDDFTRTHEELRAAWLEEHAPWRATWMMPPSGWDGVQQLLESGLLLSSDGGDTDDQADDLGATGTVRTELEYA